MSKTIILLLLTSLFVISCRESAKLSSVEGTLHSDKHIISPINKQSGVLITIDFSYHFHPKKMAKTNKSSEYEMQYAYVDNLRVEIDNKQYPIKFRQQYKRLLGKRFAIKLEHTNNLVKGGAKLPSLLFDSDNKKENAALEATSKRFAELLSWLIDPEKDKNLRTYQVRRIQVEEFLFQNGDKITFRHAILEQDTLFFSY